VAPQWGSVTPFCIPSDSAFRPPPPPALTSADYTAAFNEVKSLGAANSTTRTAEQSQIARFWYGAAGTYTATGYWNQIAQEVAQRRGDSLVQDARLFALLNLAQADAYFAVWDAKYTYNFWRPVTAIRAADTDGNPDTAADPAWTPFLVTPAHPSYSSGHSGISGAAAAVLAAFFGTDAIPFSFSSDGLPGVTRSYAGFSAAAQEVSDSRVYAGIHWRFDVQAGQVMGNEVGDYIATHFLRPVTKAHDGGADAAAATGTTGFGEVAAPSSSTGLLADRAAIDVPSAAPLGAGLLGVVVPDPTGLTGATQATDPALPLAGAPEVLDLALAELGKHRRRPG
jgi:membrane-associated phospholipid phosphatase